MLCTFPEITIWQSVTTRNGPGWYSNQNGIYVWNVQNVKILPEIWDGWHSNRERKLQNKINLTVFLGDAVLEEMIQNAKDL